MIRKSVSVHSDFYAELRNLSPENRGAVLLALLNWAEGADISPLNSECAILFRLMSAQMERISSANSANGQKGGRGNKSEKSEPFQKKPIKPPVTKTKAITGTITGTDTNLTEGIGRPADAAPPRKNKKRFIEPTVEEVVEYCQERGSSVDAQRFVAYYTSQGWRVGKNPMRDWQAAVKNWEKNDMGKQARASPARQESFAERARRIAREELHSDN